MAFSFRDDPANRDRARAAWAAAQSAARWALADKVMKSANSLKLAGRVAWNAAWGAGEAVAMGETDPAKIALSGTVMGVLGGATGHGPSWQERLTPMEKANLTKAMGEAWDAYRAGDMDGAQMRMVQTVMARHPEFDQQTALKVTNELKFASDKIMADSGLQTKPGDKGLVVGSTTHSFEADVRAAAIKLYLGFGTDTVLHEYGHHLFDFRDRNSMRALEAKYKAQGGDVNSQAFREYVVNGFTDWFMKNDLVENPVPSGVVSQAYRQAADTVKGIVDKVRGIAGNSVESEYRQAWDTGVKDAGQGEESTSNQAAMYRSRATSVGEFVDGVSPSGNEKQSYLPIESTSKRFEGFRVDLLSDTVRHSREHHPDLTTADWEKLPQVVDHVKEFIPPAKPEPKYNGKPFFASSEVDGQSYGIIGEALPNGRAIVTTFFKDNAKKIEDWLGANGNRSGAVEALAAIQPLPKPRQGGDVSSISSDKNIPTSFPSGNPVDPNSSYQVVFHGSPHRFDKFSLEKVGTGEGAQAYGHGLYFSSNRDIAEWYKRNLQPGSGSSDMDTMARIEEAAGGDLRNAARIARERANYPHVDAAGKARFEKMAEFFDSGQTTRGQVYKVDIPEDRTLLDWDKPLGEQPKDVRERLEQSGLVRPEGESQDGRTLYKALANELGSDKAASEYLRSIGIPGLRYLDGSSRNNERENHNYVIFDDAKVSVLDSSYQVRALTPDPRAQVENRWSWERDPEGKEWGIRPFEISQKAEASGQDIIRNNLPTDLKKYAVNVNLERLQTPDDIKAVIQAVGDHLKPEIESARRHTMPLSMIKSIAEEMVKSPSFGLANDLGMTEATLLQRRRGEAFNAEQAVAARMVMANSAEQLLGMARRIAEGMENSDRMLGEFVARREIHAAIQAQVSGMTAEAGRALASFRAMAQPVRGVQLSAQDLTTPPPEPSARVAPTDSASPGEYGRGLPSVEDIQNRVDQAGGRRKIIEVAQGIVDMANAGADLTQINTAIENSRKRSWGDWFDAWRYMSMLSGVPTTLRNVSSTAIAGALAIPERWLASQLGVISKRLGCRASKRKGPWGLFRKALVLFGGGEGI